MRTRGLRRGPLGPQRSWRSPSPSTIFRPPSGRRSRRTEGANCWTPAMPVASHLEPADSVYPTDLPRRVPAATGTEEASFVRLDEYEPWVEPRVRRVVADSLVVTLEDLTAEVSLADDLAADSLDVLELALVLEEEFGFPLPERALSDVRSYGDLVSATATLARERRAAEARGSRA